LGLGLDRRRHYGQQAESSHASSKPATKAS
jgi:hypothetical protein